MAWSENKRLKLTVMRESLKRQNMVVEFEISPEKREDFHRNLEYVLAACQTAGAEFDFNEIVDLESKEVHSLEIVMKGPQQAIAESIKKNMPMIQPYAVWVK